LEKWPKLHWGAVAAPIGVSDADVRTFWHKKLRIFRNLGCVRMKKGGGGQFFAIL